MKKSMRVFVILFVIAVLLGLFQGFNQGFGSKHLFGLISLASANESCGAYVAPGVWKEFDCYNLAAIGKTINDDPFTPSWRLIGGYWQWGRKGPDPSQWYNTNTSNFAHGPTGPSSVEANSGSISGWDQTYAPDGSWSKGSQAVYYLLDQEADLNKKDADGDGKVDLLLNINTNGFRFRVDNGVELSISFDKYLLLSPTEPYQTGKVITHADFVAALQPGLAQLIADGLVPADTILELDDNLKDSIYLDDGSRSSDIPAMVLRTQTDSILKPVGFVWVDDMVGDYNIYGRLLREAEVSDLCPAGFQMPTESQWQGIVENNVQRTTGSWSESLNDYTNYSSARFFGDNLMLPAAGLRNYVLGGVFYRGLMGSYWSSTASRNNEGGHLYFSNTKAEVGFNTRLFGLSVRCMTDSENSYPCTYNLSRTNSSFKSGSESHSVLVTTSRSDCAWSTSKSLPWLSLSPTRGTGSETVTISVTPNTGSGRSGSITIAGRTYAINQAGASDQTAVVLTKTSPNHTVRSGSDVKVYGTAVSNQLILESGAKAELINFPGFNTVQFQSSVDGFRVSRSGQLVSFQGTDGTVLKIPANQSVQTITFAGQEPLTLSIYDNQVMLDDQVIDVTPAAISSDVISGPEIVQLIPTGMDSVSVAWMAPSSASGAYYTYEIHMDTKDQFSPAYSTLIQSVSGDFQADVSGLNAGTTYYVLIVAVSQSGTNLPAEEYWQVTTNTVATQLNPDIDLVDAPDAGLGVPQVFGDEYVYEKSGDTRVPAVGSLLVGEDQEGGYLRKAVAVTDTGSEIVVETVQGVLSEAVTTGRISSNVRLFSPERVQREQRLSTVGQNQVKSTQSAKTDGSPYHRMEWKNKLLTVEEQISPRFEPSPRKGYRKIQLIKDRDAAKKSVYSQTEVKNQITLEASLEFEPELRTDVQWHTEWLRPVLDSGEVIALGSFRAEMSARYEFDASYNWGSSDSPNEELLWTRTWTSVYQAGPVPVFQEITLSLTYQAWAAASAEIDATASAFAQTVIEVGVRYNPDTEEWEAVAGTDFDSGLTATLDAEGTVEGEVRLVPNVEVKFYKVVGANMSLEPYTHGLINYTLDASLSGPTVAQFNNFDYLLGLDCNMHLTLWPIFDDDDPLYSAQLYTNTWPIFDLPQLSANTRQTGNEYALTAEIQDGTNNTFITDSIKWEVYGPDGNRTSLESGTYDGSGSAVFIPESAGTYQILLSGYGQLGNWVGDIARRYAIIEIESQFDPCTYSIAPHSDNFGSGGGSKTVLVTTSSSSCTWSTSENLPWVSLSPTSGTGSRSVNVMVSANTGDARSGSVTIAGKRYDISQGAASCTYSIAPHSDNFGSGGGSKSVSVTTSSSSCTWSTSENLPWVSLSPTSGAGSRSVNVMVSANTGDARSGSVTIAGKRYDISQGAASCTYSIAPHSGNFGSGGGSKSVSVTTSSLSCAWRTSENLSWVSLSPTSGTGNGSVTVLVDPNTGEARSGSVTFAGKTYTITQEKGDNNQDPGNCGAYVAPGVWKEFDCYNLAAIGKTTNDDPFTPSWRLIGGYWQWGRKGPDSSEWYDTNTKHFAHGPTGPDSRDANSDSISGWDSDYAAEGAWSDPDNDPCPEGFRVPTFNEWRKVTADEANPQRTVGTWSSSATNYYSARFYGNKLMLPAAGRRDLSGKLKELGIEGIYWTSSSSGTIASYAMRVSSGSNVTGGSWYGTSRTAGFSVRCIAEE